MGILQEMGLQCDAFSLATNERVKLPSLASDDGQVGPISIQGCCIKRAELVKQGDVFLKLFNPLGNVRNKASQYWLEGLWSPCTLAIKLIYERIKK